MLHINIGFTICKPLKQLLAAKGVFKLFAEIGMHGLRTDFNQFVKVALIGRLLCIEPFVFNHEKTVSGQVDIDDH